MLEKFVDEGQRHSSLSVALFDQLLEGLDDHGPVRLEGPQPPLHHLAPVRDHGHQREPDVVVGLAAGGHPFGDQIKLVSCVVQRPLQRGLYFKGNCFPTNSYSFYSL